MKSSILRITLSFFCGAFFSLIAVTASAGNADSDYGYYDCNGYYYKSQNRVSTTSSYAYAITYVQSQNLNIIIPSGYVGIEPCLYDANTGKAVSKYPMAYNSNSGYIFLEVTPFYYAKKGTFYSQGITRAYHVSDENAIYHPYHQFGTFRSPNQSISN